MRAESSSGERQSLYRIEVQGDLNDSLPHNLKSQSLKGISVSIASFTILLIGALAFATLAQFKETERVTGWLHYQKGFASHRVARDVIVESMLVEDGESVLEGQSIALLRHTESKNDSKDLKRQLSTVSANIAALKKQIAEEQVNHTTSASKLKLAVDRANEAYRFARSQQYEVQKLLFTDCDKVCSQTSRERIELLQMRVDMQSRVDDARDTLADLSFNQKQFDAEYERRIAQLQVQLSNLEARKRQAVRPSHVTVVSPKSGTVAFAQSAFDEAYIAEGSPLFFVLGKEREITANILVPQRAVGSVDIGQSVFVMLEAYPFHKFGVLTATILTNPTWMPSVEDPSTNNGVFLVTARLDTHRLGLSELDIRHGMTFNGEIVITQRSLFEMLIGPFGRFFARLS